MASVSLSNPEKWYRENEGVVLGQLLSPVFLIFHFSKDYQYVQATV
jgi:hypothetical protein